MSKRTSKIWPLTAVSVILGLIITFRDISLCFSLINTYDLPFVQPVILDTIIAASYATVLIFCLLWLNISWSGKGSKNEAVLFALSLVFVMAVFGIADSIPHHTDLEDYYHRFLFSADRPPHHKVNILAVKSIAVLFICYIGSLIFKLYLNKVESEKKLEKLRAESLQSKLTALSNQISPHFFFNALNSLHSLILEDKKDGSLAYLSALSNVFRYVLRGDMMSIITLKEELEFIEEYKYMLSIKYGGRLSFESNIEQQHMNLKLPVMSLLPLIENVIKHNEISSAHPMTIHLTVLNGFLVIKNGVRKKIDPPPSGGIGLNNLANRYRLLLNREIVVASDENEFSVSLPLKGDSL